MKFIGDIEFGQTIDFKFNTSQSDGTPVSLAGSPAVAVYKASGIAESSAGVTLTTDFNNIFGCHHVSIFTNNIFYEPGNDFQIVLVSGMVDGIDVSGTVLAEFSIENRVVKSLGALSSEAQNDVQVALSNQGYTPIRAGQLDKLAVSGTIAHTDISNLFMFDPVSTPVTIGAYMEGLSPAEQVAGLLSNPDTRVNLNLTQVIPLAGNAPNSVADCLNAARAQGFGVWRIDGSTLRLYGPDGITVVREFQFNDAANPTERV